MTSRILIAQRVSKDNGGPAVQKEWTPLHLNKQIYNGTMNPSKPPDPIILGSPGYSWEDAGYSGQGLSSL